MRLVCARSLLLYMKPRTRIVVLVLESKALYYRQRRDCYQHHRSHNRMMVVIIIGMVIVVIVMVFIVGIISVIIIIIVIRDILSKGRRRWLRERYLKILFPVIVIILRLFQVVRHGKCVSTFQKKKLVWTVWMFGEKTENRKFIVRCLRPPHNLKFDHFTSLSGRERHRNVSKSETHVQDVQSYCFFSLTLLCCGILVEVAVVLACLRFLLESFRF